MISTNEKYPCNANRTLVDVSTSVTDDSKIQNAHGDQNLINTIVKCILIGDKCVGKTSLVVSYTSNDYPDEYKPSALDTYCVDVCAGARPVQLQICDAGGKLELSSLRQLSYPGCHVILLCFSVMKPDTFRSLRMNWLRELALSPILLNPVAQMTASQLFGLSFPPNPAQPVRSNRPPTAQPGNSKSKTSKAAKHGPVPGSHEPDLLPGPTFLLIGCACDLRNDIGRLLELSKLGQEPVDHKLAELFASEIGAEAYVECSALTQKNLKTVFDLAIWSGLRVADLGGPAQAVPAAPNSSHPDLALSVNHDSAHITQKNNGTVHGGEPKSTTPNSHSHNEPKMEKRGWRKYFCIV